MRLSNKIIIIFFIAVTLFFISYKKAYADIYFYGNTGIAFYGGTIWAEIQSVPEYIRDVPIHPDDGYADEENIAPIEQDKINLLPCFFIFEGKLGLGITYYLFDLRIGPTIGLINCGNYLGPIERNYTDAPGTDKKGEKAALTYYDFQIGQIDYNLFYFIPGISIETLLFFTEYYVFYVFMEYNSEFLYELYLENGWDRYSSLQIRETYKLVDIIKHTVKLGIGYTVPALKNNIFEVLIDYFIGLSIPQIINKTDLYNEVDLTMYISVLFGMSIKFGLMSKSR